MAYVDVDLNECYDHGFDNFSWKYLLTPEEVDYAITDLFILINIENIQLLK